MKITLCPICVGVSSVWLLLSAGVAWGYLAASTYLTPIALLMGGTVVGIAYLGEKRCVWAAQHPQLWKTSVVITGMPTAYFLVTHLTKLTVAVELFFLLIISYFFFVQRPSQMAGGSSNKRISEIEEQMEQCC